MRDLLVFGHPQRQQRPSPLLRTIVGGVLRRTRLSQRRTLADVAASARISMQYLSELERGRKEASSEILAALCAALGLDLSELLAAAGHDLLDQRGRRPGVPRIGAFREAGAQPAQRGLPPGPSGDSADRSLAGFQQPGGADSGDVLSTGEPAGGELSSPARGAGAADPVCRLAA